MKKILFSFFILLVFMPCFAQVSGYLGKRMSIGYSNYFFPRIPAISLTSGTVPADKKMNSTHCLDMDYIVAPRVSVCLSGQFSRMGLFSYGNKIYVESRGNSNGNNVEYLPDDESNLYLNTTNISFGIKIFKERYLNPFGRYRKLELIVMMNKVNADENGFYSVNRDYGSIVTKTPYPLSSDETKSKSIVVAYTMGKQRILFNKLVLDWGVRLGINQSYVFRNIGLLGALGGSNYDNSIGRKLKEEAIARTVGSQFINLHLGLRFLAF